MRTFIVLPCFVLVLSRSLDWMEIQDTITIPLCNKRCKKKQKVVKREKERKEYKWCSQKKKRKRAAIKVIAGFKFDPLFKKKKVM